MYKPSIEIFMLKFFSILKLEISGEASFTQNWGEDWGEVWFRQIQE